MIILRPAFLADAPALAQLGNHSFCAAFAHLYRAEDLNIFLSEVYSEEAVRGEIESENCFHRLAVEGESLAAYCKMYYNAEFAEYSDAKNPITLGQLYTAPERTGQGLGARLMDWAIDFAKERGHDAIQLTVWSENYGAQKFYQRYGFHKIADIYFMVGNHRDDELLYELRLK